MNRREFLGTAVAVLLLPFLAVAKQPMGQVVDEAFADCFTRCWSPRTSLLYGCGVKYVKKAATFKEGLYDWYQGSKEGYGAGMGDCAISDAVALSGCVDRWAALTQEGVPADDLRFAQTADWAAKLARGLLNLSSKHGYTGFVARGLCEEDGKSICSLSSIDQHTHWVHGLYRYAHSAMAKPEIVAEWKVRVAEVAARMERTVKPETGYNFGLCDGRPDPRGICRMWWPESTNSTASCRLPSIYAAAYDATGDQHWKDLYERLADKACHDAAFLEWNKKVNPQWKWRAPTYTLLQMNVSIEVMLGCEQDPKRRAGLLEGLRQSAAEADFRAKDMWTNPKKKWYGMAPDAELALAQLTANHVPYDETELKIFEKAVRTGDAKKWWSLKTTHMFAAYWRARLRGLIRADEQRDLPVAGAGPAWTFNHGDDVRRLVVGQGTALSVLGLNRIQATGSDLTLSVPLTTNEIFGAAERPYLAFRYRIRSKIKNGGLFFTTDTMGDLAKSYSQFPVVADGTWRHQTVDLRPYKHGHWRGRITSFRLDPINPSVPGDSVEVSRMGFFATPEEAERFLSAADDAEDYLQPAKLVNDQAAVYIPAGTLKPGWRQEDYLMAADALPPGDGELAVVCEGQPVPSFVNRRGYAFYVADKPGVYSLAREVRPRPLTAEQTTALGLVASDRARPSGHFSRERIRLAGWGLFRDQNFDVQRVKDFAACGLDMLIASPVDSGSMAPDLLSACDEVGVEIYLRAGDNPKTADRAYDHHPSYAGAYLVDEPGTDDFARWGAVAKTYHEASGRRPFINLLPMYANAAQLKYGAHAAAIEYYDRDPQLYRKYCEAYCDQVDTDYICTDIYPLNWVNGLPKTFDGYIESINIIASVARERGREFWCCLQPFGWRANKRTANASEFRWQSYSLLSFGCRALHCWVYAGYKAEYPSLTTIDGERTAAWYDARTVFREIRAISDVYCSYRNLGAFTHGCTDATPYLKMTDEYRDFKTINSIRCASPLLVGCFAAKKGDGTAFTVVNMNDFLQGRSALVKMDIVGSRVVAWRKGVPETLCRGKDGLYDLPLECGEGVFVAVEPAGHMKRSE